MARDVRIDALAVECGLAPAALLCMLEDLGHREYSRASQRLPESIAGELRQRCAGSTVRPEPGAENERSLFEQAMSAAGVRPLAAAPAGRASGRPSRIQPSVGPTPAAGALRTVPDPPPARDPAAEALGALRAERDALAAQVAGLELRLREVLGALEELRTGERQAVLLAESRSTGTPPPTGAERSGPHARLLDLLQARGLRGADEAGLALRKLLGAHLLDASLPTWSCADAPRIARVLGERLCLCCGQEGCGQPEGVEPIPVPVQRCELCGGQDPRRVFRRLSDACLLCGVNRLLLVGGRRWQQSWFEGRLDRRVVCRSWPGELACGSELVDLDLGWAQLALVWEDAGTSPALAALVRERLQRACLPLGGGSAGAFLAAAVEAVEALDPSCLAGA